MSSPIPMDFYPVAVVQDRYRGTYSGGEWLGVAAADATHEHLRRVSRVLAHGPHGCDMEAGDFWADPPRWIAAGATPELAIDALLARVER